MNESKKTFALAKFSKFEQLHLFSQTMSQHIKQENGNCAKKQKKNNKEKRYRGTQYGDIRKDAVTL